MIDFVRGAIVTRDPGGIVLQVGGIGLRVLAPTSTLATIGSPGDTATLHTFLLVREELLALYGFGTVEERRTFELLMLVSGVGPRMALGLLSALSVEQLTSAIANSNVDLLTIVPGIGKRLASRIVLDLKDKMGGKGVRPSEVPTSTADGDVIEALTQVFGYSFQQAAEAVSALGEAAPADLEERIRAALRHFSTGR